MSMEEPRPVESPAKRGIGVKAALVSAGVAAGVIGATALGANAVTSSNGSSTAGSAPSSAPSGRFDPGGAQPVRDDETSVSAALAAKLNAAALDKVPGGEVVRVETDAGDAAYEVHMRTSDGWLVTVKFDKDLGVTGVEDGMGQGDPAPDGAGHGGPPNR